MWKIVVWTCGALLCACGAEVPTPRLTGVDPDWGYNGESTDISLEGQELLPRVQVTGGEADRFDHQWRGWILADPEVELAAVQAVSYEQLNAVVPEGIAPGVYGLRIEAPTGKKATIPDAFTVTSTRADHLAVSTTGISWTVEEVAILSLSLQDPAGETVPEALEVEITVETNSSDSGAYSFELGGLPEATLFPDGSGVRGRLGITGDAFIGFTSKVPDDIWLRVTPVGRPNIERASQLLSFRAGRVAGLEIDLPTEDFSTTAGTSFPIEIRMVDDVGNPVSGEHATVALVESCSSGTLNLVEAFVDDAVVDVTLTAATSDDCVGNSIVAFGVVEGSTVEGRSDPVLVKASSLYQLDVHAGPTEVQAGRDPVTVFVSGRDEWGNAVEAELPPVTLSDHVGPLVEAAGNGTHSCDDLDPGEALCTATLFISGDARPILASVPMGAEGKSNALSVSPGPADHVDVLLLASTAVAGEAFTVGVQVLDEFGNPFPLTSAMLTDLTFLDDTGPIGCVLVSSDESTAIYTHHCSGTVALAGNHVTVLAAALGALGTSGPFDLIAGPLDEVLIDLDPSSEDDLGGGVFAGDTWPIQLVGQDAFGNPSHDSVEVQLANVTDTLTPPLVSLEDGIADVNVQITGAMQGDSIRALFGGAQVGTSVPFDVFAGPAMGLELSLEESWGWVGSPLKVDISVVDEFSNPIPDEVVDVLLRSLGGLGEDAEATIVGSGEIDFLLDGAGIGDRLLVTGGDWSDTSRPFDSALDCIDGPSLSPAVTGVVHDSLCLDEDGKATANIYAGVEGLHHYRFVVNRRDVGASGNAIQEYTWEEGQSGEVQVLGMDASGCGDAGAAPVFVGTVGEATGQVVVLPSRETLIAGTTGGDESTEVSLSARQCTGDVAAGERIYVRADLGRLEAVEGGAISGSGTGLEVALDSSGEGRLVWSAAESHHGGLARLLAGTASRSASGVSVVTIEGDSSPPEVLAQTPVGATGTVFDELVVDFSEAMLTSLSGATMLSAVELRDPEGEVVSWSEALWSEAGHRLSVVLPVAQDPTGGAWQLTLTDELRDLAGNRLDGDINAVAGGDHVVRFGAVPLLPPDVVSCRPDTSVFRPDGDPASGMESDRVVVDIETDIDGEWWWIEVVDMDGSLVQRLRSRRAGFTMGALEWDGRDLSGAVVDNGLYLLEVTAADEYWNAGLSCNMAIRVDNHLSGEE